MNYRRPDRACSCSQCQPLRGREQGCRYICRPRLYLSGRQRCSLCRFSFYIREPPCFMRSFELSGPFFSELFSVLNAQLVSLSERPAPEFVVKNLNLGLDDYLIAQLSYAEAEVNVLVIRRRVPFVEPSQPGE